ncbi:MULTISPECIES: SNF2-related protein, partial [unclassified Pseudomonas]|uniref:SNF2-related protein n=1 Tax=unclassified Pseudomonas TaxID=196821 RepID=UPI001A9D487E
LAHILSEKNAGRLDRPCMVVMPTSLIPNWLDEAAHFTPQLKVLALHGTGRQKDFANLGAYDLVLTTYALLPRDLEILQPQS